MIKPKAIVFDYGDTLLKSDFFSPLDGCVELLKHAHNPNKKSGLEIQSYADSILKDLASSEGPMTIQVDSKALMRLIYEVHGISFEKSYEELDAIFLAAAERTSLMPGVVELLDYLKSQGIRLAVLSNTGFCEKSHRQALRKHGIEGYFEFFIATSDYLIRKPDKRIFDLALAKLDINHKDVWYVGNKFEYDVLGAFNAKIFPVWINEESKAPHRDIEHLSVNSYGVLLDLLKDVWST